VNSNCSYFIRCVDLTLKQWRKWAYLPQSERLEKRYRERHGLEPYYLAMANAGSLRTASWDRFRERFMLHVHAVTSLLPTIQDPYRSHIRLRRHQRRQSAIQRVADRVFTNFRDDRGRVRRVMICGDAVWASSIKGTQSSPNKALCKALGQRGLVLLIPEYRTSVACSICAQTIDHENEPWIKMKNRYDLKASIK